MSTGNAPPSQILHNILSKEDIEELYNLFRSHMDKQFTEIELRKILERFDIFFDNFDFRTMFLKMNINRDNAISWDEFISYLILGFQKDDPYSQKETLIKPIEGAPITRASMHRHPIIRILFCPTVLLDRTSVDKEGSIITVSKDGEFRYWTMMYEHIRSGKSKNPFLKIASTWILDAVSLADVRIVCTSSSERDLRFYDTTANNFHLRIVITSLPHAVNCMHYYFSADINQDCRLILGDICGNVKLITFNATLRGPFQSKPGAGVIVRTWNEVLRGKINGMKVKEYLDVHNDVVRQVSYSDEITSIISCAETALTSGTYHVVGLALINVGIQTGISQIRITGGVSCFEFDPVCGMLATGGLDTILRLWNPIMVEKPIALLPGHHAGITTVFIQDGGQKLYSLDKERILKVWDINEQTLIQTFIGFVTPGASFQHNFRSLYIDSLREFIVASYKISSIKCCPLLQLELTDGTTHSKAISVILYNKLFKTVITCGLDSCIIVWDPWQGKRLTLIKMAHTRIIYGEIVRVEITAACFDPKEQLLLTGARNGSLKVWNFNNGVCIRNLNIEDMCEVTAVFWLNRRMLAVGWNKHVTEFADSMDTEHGNSKVWDTLHSDDVICAAVKEPETLVTCSYTGDFVLWKLETGQAYRKYVVEYPFKRIRLGYDDKKKDRVAKYARGMTKVGVFRKDPLLAENGSVSTISSGNESTSQSDITRMARRLSVIQLPARAAMHRSTSVVTAIFLKTRPMSPEFGSLFMAIETGTIQVYSHHNLGGFMDNFNPIHIAGDTVITMETDSENKYLFVGTSAGYIKTWLVVNYCVPQSHKKHINWPKTRLQFPFLLRDRWEGRAKRSARNIEEPKLLNSYTAHADPVTCLMLIEKSNILVSGSVDKSVRLWTLGGRYLGTLGSPVPWVKLDPHHPPPEVGNYRIPPDISRSASSTTLKVFKGGDIVDPLKALRDSQKHLEETPKLESKQEVYGKPLSDPIVGKNFKLPPRLGVRKPIALNNRLPYIPVYSHLKYYDADILVRPPTPRIIEETKNFDIIGDVK